MPSTFSAKASQYRKLVALKRQQGKPEVASFLTDYCRMLDLNDVALRRNKQPQFPEQSVTFKPQLMPGGVRAVLFDMYMTLVYQPPGYAAPKALAKVLDVSDQQAVDAYKATADSYLIGAIDAIDRMQQMLALMGVVKSRSKLEELLAIERKAYIGATVLYPGVHNLLKSLRKRGYAVGIVSNANPLGRAAAVHHGLLNVVTGVFSSDSPIASVKPLPKIYLNACERLAVKPQDCLFVDDSGTDFALEGAQALGMKTVLVDHPGTEQARLIRPLSDFHVSKVAELTLS